MVLVFPFALAPQKAAQVLYGIDLILKLMTFILRPFTWKISLYLLSKLAKMTNFGHFLSRFTLKYPW